MIDFTYTAKRQTGEAATGTISAESQAHAREQLRGEGLFPMSVRSRSPMAAGKPKKLSGGKVRQTDLLMLTSQLSIMSRSGIDLADALKSVADECSNATLRKTLQQVYDDVSAGDTVSAALGRHADLFGDTYVVAIQAAEASGQMAEVLERLTRLLRYEIRLRNTIRGILTYPSILFAVALLVSFALVFFVLPQFATVFADLGAPIPPTTQLLLDVSVFCRSWIFWILPAAALLVTLLWKAMRTDSARTLADRVLLSVRGLGPAVQSLASGRIFTLMGTMLQSGIPLLDALGLCRTATSNRLLQQLLGRLEDDVLNGRGVAAGLFAATCIPSGAAQMIATAERTGRLADVVQTVGEFYEEEGERQIRQAMKFLEPAIILTMGIFVSCIVMSVMLPLLDVTNVS